jgi:hypothetical protein
MTAGRGLASFWDGPYFDVRKDLRGRYLAEAYVPHPTSSRPTQIRSLT